MKNFSKLKAISFLFVLLLFSCLRSQIDTNRIDTITIKTTKEGKQILTGKAIKSEVLNSAEFKKAACCTLSESFETTNSVEVSGTDAVSGVSKLEMLGLPGKYVQINQNQVNLIRGINALTGLTHIAGPMVDQVYLSKGAGSVTNGFESITGAIDYSLKLTNAPTLFVNSYINSQLRNEQNIIFKIPVNKKLINTSYLNAMSMPHYTDINKDNFIDQPLTQMYHLENTTKFENESTEGELSVKYINSKDQGGQYNHWHKENKTNPSKYLLQNNFNGLSGYGKLGIFLPNENSIGNIVQVHSYNRKINLPNTYSSFKDISSAETFFKYTGLLEYHLKNEIGTKSGVDFTVDYLTETATYKSITDTSSNLVFSNYKENIVGIFTEWSKEWEKTEIIVGLRANYSNLFGWFVTPRMHLKYALNLSNSLHIQAGIGRKRSNIFSDNFPILLGNRDVYFNSKSLSNTKNLNMSQDIGYNTGISYTKKFKIKNQNSSISIDYFYTWFKNQWVADRDVNAYSIYFKNQKGNYSNSFQIDWLWNITKKIELNTSYRFAQFMQFTGNKWQQQFLQAPHRIVQSFSYKTENNWSYNLIWHSASKARYPSQKGLNTLLLRPLKTPWFNKVNVLVQKTIRKWEIYGGIENLLNVAQPNPIMNSTNLNENTFDPAWSWGINNGITFLLGVRFSVL